LNSWAWELKSLYGNSIGAISLRIELWKSTLVLNNLQFSFWCSLLTNLLTISFLYCGSDYFLKDFFCLKVHCVIFLKKLFFEISISKWFEKIKKLI
jgi:hypothetical protein